MTRAQLTGMRAVTDLGGKVFKGVTPLSISTELERLEGLDDNWDGRDSEGPNAHALGVAREFGILLDDRGLFPERVVASPDGGVEFYFFPFDGPESSYVVVLILNEGGVVGSSIETDEDLSVWEFQESQLSEVMRKVGDSLG